MLQISYYKPGSHRTSAVQTNGLTKLGEARGSFISINHQLSWNTGHRNCQLVGMNLLITLFWSIFSQGRREKSHLHHERDGNERVHSIQRIFDHLYWLRIDKIMKKFRINLRKLNLTVILPTSIYSRSKIAYTYPPQSTHRPWDPAASLCSASSHHSETWPWARHEH